MDLILVLRLFIRENQIQRDLVGLVYDVAVAAYHFAHMKLDHPGNGLQELVAPGNETFRGLGIGWIRPKNYNV